jgi:hypothetical protein
MRMLLALALSGLIGSQSPAPLRIVVIEGEDAVNIVQQKTAVRPLVEVRDRNNLPVAGATVTFSIAGGEPAAFAGGVHALTVTTNAAGQAAAGGFNALGPGAVHVQVQAAFQGQVATAAISQTNFATAAAASQAAAGASSTSAGGGGGVSGTTIGVVGAAVAGGALAATKIGGDDAVGKNDASYRGTGTAQMTTVVRNTSDRFDVTCTTTWAFTATVAITLRDDSGANVNVDGTRTYVASSATDACPQPDVTALPFHFEAAGTGGPANLTFRATNNFSGPIASGGISTGTETMSLDGAVSGESIVGTLVFETQSRATGSVTANGVPFSSALSGAVTVSLALPLIK